MKLKNEFISAFAKLQLVEISSPTRRYNCKVEAHTLEASDFDKAISILMYFNKKAAVKEFQLLKEEFLNGENMEYRYFEPTTFINHLKEVLTKRMSDIEERKAIKQVEETWNVKDLLEFEGHYAKMFNAYNDTTKLQGEILRLNKVLEIRKAKEKSIKDWIKKEVEENETSLDKISIKDLVELTEAIDCYEEEEKALGHTWY